MMQIKHIQRIAVLAVALVLWGMPSGTRGAAILAPGELTITAAYTGGPTISQSFSVGTPTSSAPFQVTYGGLDVTLFYDYDGLDGHGFCVDLNFNTTVTAGQADPHPEVRYTITSAMLGGFSLVNPTAQGSAGLTLTDWDSDGAYINGHEPEPAGGFTFSALYNGANDAANILPGPAVGPDDGTAVSAPLLAPVPGTVTNISSEWDFTLSANDEASGTSVYCLVPEPCTMGLLAVGGLFVLRRRRLA